MKLMKVTIRKKDHLVMESAKPFIHRVEWISLERDGTTISLSHSGNCVDLRQGDLDSIAKWIEWSREEGGE